MRRFIACFFGFLGSLMAEEWSAPVDLSSAGADATDCSVVMSDEGVMVSVWKTSGGVYVSDSTWGGGWSVPKVLQSGLGETPVYAPKVCMNESSCAVVTWGGDFVQSPFGGIFSSVFKDGNWSSPVGACFAANFTLCDVAKNSSGQVALVAENGSVPAELYVSSLTGYCNWSVETLPATTSAKSGKIRVSSNGLCYVLWVQPDSGNDAVWAMAKCFDGGWPSIYPTSGVLLSDSSYISKTPDLAVDDNGRAVAVWVSTVAGEDRVFVKRKEMIGDWEVASTQLSVSGGAATNPKVAMDHHGNVIAVWERFDGANTRIQASVCNWGGAWSIPEDISAAGFDASKPVIAMSHHKQAAVLWKRSDGVNTRIEADCYIFGAGWSHVEVLSAAGQNALEPSAQMNEEGHVVVVWRRFDGVNWRVQASTTTALPSIPLNVSGSQMVGSDLSGNVIYYNQITWDACPCLNMSYYKVYRNSVHIGSVYKLKDSMLYNDWNQSQGVSQAYEVSGVTTGGIEGPKASISIHKGLGGKL